MSDAPAKARFPWASVVYALFAIYLVFRAAYAVATGTMRVPGVSGDVTIAERPGLFWSVSIALLIVGGSGLYALVGAIAAWRRERTRTE